MTTLGLWTHVFLSALVVSERARTTNPIWGELRVCLSVVATAAIWCALDWSLR